MVDQSPNLFVTAWNGESPFKEENHDTFYVEKDGDRYSTEAHGVRLEIDTTDQNEALELIEKAVNNAVVAVNLNGASTPEDIAGFVNEHTEAVSAVAA